jgi:hypothetical protein
MFWELSDFFRKLFTRGTKAQQSIRSSAAARSLCIRAQLDRGGSAERLPFDARGGIAVRYSVGPVFAFVSGHDKSSY